MVVSALARGGGPLALGVVLGTMLALLGAGALWLRAHGGGAASGDARRAAPARTARGARTAAREPMSERARGRA